MTVTNGNVRFGTAAASDAASLPLDAALAGEPAETSFKHIPACCIDDLSDGVLGAGLEVAQFSKAPVMGSLAFVAQDGILCSTGHLTSRVALSGPLSETMTTLGIGLKMPPGARQWLGDVTSGVVGVFLAGDEHDAFYVPGTLYATVTLPQAQLEQAAAKIGLVLDARTLGGSGIADRGMDEPTLASLQQQFESLHEHPDTQAPRAPQLAHILLDTLIHHLARDPRPQIGGVDPQGHARIVARARDYILQNLENPIAVDNIAAAAFTSRRTLHRAFCHVLDETPQTYVRKIRLNRIHQRLASRAEVACTVTMVAHDWGIGELGRLSGWYRDLFGQTPSETLRGLQPRLAQSA